MFRPDVARHEGRGYSKMAEKGICHGRNFGIVALSDGSVQQLNDATLVQTLLGYNPAIENR
jgi:hypothetical protein